MQQLYTVVMISVRDTTLGKARAAYRPVVSTPVNPVVGEADGMIVETKYAREYDQTLTTSFRLRLTDGRRGTGLNSIASTRELVARGKRPLRRWLKRIHPVQKGPPRPPSCKASICKTDYSTRFG